MAPLQQFLIISSAHFKMRHIYIIIIYYYWWGSIANFKNNNIKKIYK